LNRIYYENKFPAKPPIIISNIPLPFEVEEDALIRNEGINRYLPYLISEAVRLEKAGAEFLVLPCNSMHVYISELRDSINVPLLSIIEENVKFLQKNNIKRIGVISTAITLKNQLYERKFNQYGIEYYSPEKDEQEYLNQLILDIVNGITNGEARKRLNKIIESFSRYNIDKVLLACTDLQELNPTHDAIKIFDSMKIFVDSTVEFMVSD
jgi:aspartate racemase